MMEIFCVDPILNSVIGIGSFAHLTVPMFAHNHLQEKPWLSYHSLRKQFALDVDPKHIPFNPCSDRVRQFDRVAIEYARVHRMRDNPLTEGRSFGRFEIHQFFTPVFQVSFCPVDRRINDDGRYTTIGIIRLIDPMIHHYDPAKHQNPFAIKATLPFSY